MNPGPAAQRLLIVHTTGYRYEGPVTASYNEARMTPLTTSRQALLDEQVDVSPVTWKHRYTDYWGSQVTAFDVLVPHTEMSVVSSATVEVFDQPEPVAPTIGWDALHDDSVTDEHHEFLVQTPLTEPPEEVVDLARGAASGLDPAQAARAVLEALIQPMEYAGGFTSVRTPASEVWAARRGVCQDFAHLGLGALRALGIPARYVSGYLHPEPDAGLGDTVEAESHAWLEWWSGRWEAYDPTHAGTVSTDHVLVARGRDYADVPPLKGVYAGSPASTLFVAVEVTRLR
ncbi:MAG: transglutaminase family protein [Kineosporiaceae bacterium]|nr:transglutaminase family protein [Kineosporiaceae bacterium]